MDDESTIQQQIQIEAVGLGCQLLRNNSGAFKDAQGRFVWFGLGNTSKKRSDKIKSSDLIGFTRVVVTQAMVGQTIAVFTACEVKKPGWKLTLKDARERAQLAFIDWIYKNGGRAGFAQSIDDLKKIIGV